MSLLGLELNDTGIIVAGGEPAYLLDVDCMETESPGFAFLQNNHLIIGKDAQSRARLNPRLYTNRFWDELSAEPLKQPGLEGKNNAELAYMHLSKIWDAVKKQGDELVVAVPGFFTQNQLGLILGIAKELSIPIKGFMPSALAASTRPYPNCLLFHLDIYLHRIEVTFLEQNDHLLQKNSETLSGKGLSFLYSEWAKAVADEFVRTTRFDPFDQAIYDQELHRRLPRALRKLQVNPSIVFEMEAGSQTYRITLTYDLLAKAGRAVFREVYRIIEGMAEKYDTTGMPIVVEVTHRVSQLPGYKEELRKTSTMQIVELESGSSATGLLKLRKRFNDKSTGKGVTFLSTRSWPTDPPTQGSSIVPSSQNAELPSHVLYGDRAYPISDKPLIIGQRLADGVTIYINDEIAGVSQSHCTIQLRGNEVILVNSSTSGTFVDGVKVEGVETLKLGQTIQIGSPEEKFHLILCVRPDEA